MERRPLQNSRSAALRGLHLALVALSVLLLALPGRRYAIDRATCAGWPAFPSEVAYSTAYLAALALGAVGWLGLAGVTLDGRAAFDRRRDALLAGVALHGLALLSPPFLSQDPLFYTAIGRALLAGRSPYAPLDGALDPRLDGALFALLPPRWQHGTSAYWPGFLPVAGAVAKLGARDLARELRLWQVVGLLSMAATAALTGAAARRRALAGLGSDGNANGNANGNGNGNANGNGDADGEAAGARAAALVIFAPLAIVDGTISAHNDGLLAVATAGFVLLVCARRPLLALLPLALAVSVKASGLLLLAVPSLRPLFAALPPRRRRLVAVLLVAAAAVALLLGAPLLASFTRLFGDPRDPSPPGCLHSAECPIRYGLFALLPGTAAQWSAGMVVRLLAAAWMVLVAARAAERDDLLAATATALTIYWLFLHAALWSWYLLPLLPLAPFAPRAIRATILVFAVSGCLYYAVDLRSAHGCPQPGWIDPTPLLLVPPFLALVVSARRRRG